MKIVFLFLAIYFGLNITLRMLKNNDIFIIQMMLFTIGLIGFLVLQFDWL